MEKWKDIEGYEGYYQVSDLGRVKSLDRVVRHQKGGPYKLKGRILSPRPSGRYGYIMVHLCKDGHMWDAKIHRLVLTSFIGPCPEGKECLHGPAGVSDNSIGNLKWGSKSENSYDMHYRDCTGNGRAVIRSDGVEFINMCIAAEKSNCSNRNIWSCCKGHRKHAGGYGWKYKE